MNLPLNPPCIQFRYLVSNFIRKEFVISQLSCLLNFINGFKDSVMQYKRRNVCPTNARKSTKKYRSRINLR